VGGAFRTVTFATAIGLVVGGVARADGAATAEVRIAPAPDGRVGAWLVAGPFHASTFALKKKPSTPEALLRPPDGVDETRMVVRRGATIDGATAPLTEREIRPKPAPQGPLPWTLASSNEGAIDLLALLHANELDVVAYVAGTLHVATAGRYYLLIGADDGLRVSVDGRAVLTRDEARPQRDDDDMVPLDLAAGDHALLFKLHQRDGGWRFGARVVDETLRAPASAWVTLPGTDATDARDLAARASWVSLDRGLEADGYHPKVTVKFLEGAPYGVPLAVRVSMARAGRGAARLFDVDAGEVPIDAGAAGEIVVALPPLVRDDAAKLEDGDYVYTIDVAGRTLQLPFFARRATRDAVAHADRSLAALIPSSSSLAASAWLHEGSLDSVRYLRERLARLVDHGDTDADAQAAEARELDEAATALDHATDPYERRTGPIRRAYVSPADGDLHEFGLYVPAGYAPGTKKRWPLVVALHGMNGKAMAMLRWFFGGDVKGKEQDWEDRHWNVAPAALAAGGNATSDDEALPPLDAFVVAPSGHGNAMYRDLGEDDVMRVLDWATRSYPIDLDRVTITGPSMGGIGTAAIAFRHPDRFAAAAPLCGYHSYFVRRDVMGRAMRPWERVLAEERSNVEWAENGENLPLWIVHGTKDLPEANSGVLIDRYEQLGYSLKQDHPELGHNVWQTTYAGLQGAKWLLRHKRVAHPRHVLFRTIRLRDGDDAWEHVTELASSDGWGELDGEVTSRTSLVVKTSGLAALRLDRDPALVDPTSPTTVTADGVKLAFDASEPIELHRQAGTWSKGPGHHEGVFKQGDVTGPIRDAFHAPLLFVYGADDPAQTRANEEVARAWAQIRYGTSVKYPIVSDAEFFARGEPLANEHALFLVGNARSNRVVRALEPELPIRIDGDAVTLGGKRITGNQVGAAFVRPNPKRSDRYVVVVEGIDALGTWRSLSLPDLLPDFVVWDEQVAPSRGQVLLGAGMLRAAGFFTNEWALPESIDDPLASRPRPSPKSEYDATPYLP
jgi:poly(3-hydroxybutyrate) depolymerase